MAINRLLHIFSFFTLLLTLAVSSTDPPEYSPSPSPPLQSGSDDSVSAPPPSIGSPPAPTPSDLTNSPSLDESSPPSPSPSPSPSPPQSVASDVSTEEKSEEKEKSSSGGMRAGKKVGIAFGLIAAASFVIFVGVLYRKRQRNIRRAQYSQSARLEFF